MTTADILAAYRRRAAEAREANEVRRACVLKHEDLRERLCQQPLNFARPEQWSGYVAPKTDPAEAGGQSRINTASRRAALVEISAEALRREQVGASPAAVG